MAKIIDVEGIGPKYAKDLTKVGVTTTGKLLKEGATRKGRDELAKKSGISYKLILEWVNHADLHRIKGVAEEYSDLLEEAGVDSVPELAQRNPDNLHKKMVEVNKAKKLVRQLPSQKQVTAWVKQAKALPRMVHH